jgi:iron complex transport system substrate-binding protein
MSKLAMPQGPRRIVCLTEEPTEILYALGEGDRVVGISAYTVRPPEAPRDKPVVSAFVGGSVEKIAALEPDLVVGFSDIQADLASKLISANLPVLIFNQRSLQEILEVVLDLGSLVGARERAQSLVASYVERIDAAAERGAKRSSRPRVYFEEWDDPMICGIQWVSELIEIAGGEDVFRDRSRGKAARDRFVSDADIVARDPEIMLAAWCGKPLDRASVLARPGLQGVTAIRAGRIHEIPAELILQPGPACLTDGLDFVERVLGD